jgi:hypothetical protein
MKVIFLDHDGVICLAAEWGGRHAKRHRAGCKRDTKNKDMPLDLRFDNFNQKAVDILNDIIEQTGAEIVVSSDWKQWATCEEMGEYYESKGICKKPIAYTPNLSKCTVHGSTFIWSQQWDLEQTRSIEIKQYLHDHPEVTHWVAIDDLDMANGESWKNWGLTNFVLTPKSREGIKQSGIKEKILEFLLSGEK